MIFIEDNFLNKEDCIYLKQLAEENRETADSYNDIHTLNLHKLNLKKTVQMGHKLSNNISMRGILAYPELMQITIWPTETEQSVHVDETRDSTNFTSITYLNDDYTGGETYFTNGINIKPKQGKTVFFDGKRYQHGVKRITDKERFVLATWYTNDINNMYYKWQN